MKKSRLIKTFHLSIILILISCSSANIPNVQRIDIKYYETTADYLKGIETLQSAFTKIRNIGKDYIRIGRIFSADTNKKLTNSNGAWLIEYNNDSYLNMSTNTQYSNPGVYVKLDLVGRIMTFVISDETSSELKTGGTNYGAGFGIVGGVAGALFKDGLKWGKNWFYANGKKGKIITANIKPDWLELTEKHRNAKSRILTKENFNKQLNLNYPEERIDNMTIEDVMEVIQAYNENNAM